VNKEIAEALKKELQRQIIECNDFYEVATKKELLGGSLKNQKAYDNGFTDGMKYCIDILTGMKSL
tara:strand:+ start:12317 stop:12511 length:195 start_codon:yes stop_codon:yes gene_type:complete